MRVYVSSPGEKPIRITVPTRLLLNQLTATIGARYIQRQLPADREISAGDLRRFVKELHRMRKKHPDLYLVDVENADGEVVQIQL